MKHEFLRAAILSGALVIGLLTGLLFSYIVRNFYTVPPRSDVSLLQQE